MKNDKNNDFEEIKDLKNDNNNDKNKLNYFCAQRLAHFKMEIDS